MVRGRGLLLASLLCLAGLHVDAREHTWRGVQRIVAVGDVHGDHGQFVKTLRAAGVLDARGRWVGGKTHLVQTGDVFDRGPDSRKTMDLLMRLEAEAPRAGGMVHPLIGNHEAMVLCGDWRYVHPGEWKAFGGKEKYKRALGPRGKYGRWLRTHNAVIKINDLLFLHGGLSQRYATMSLSKINDGIRQGLLTCKGMSRDGAGPLWFRGLARKEGSELRALLAPIFETHGVRHVVVGHTVAKGVTVRAGGGVIQIDVGMSRAYGGPAACLLVEKGVFYAVRADKGKRKLAVGK